MKVLIGCGTVVVLVVGATVLAQESTIPAGSLAALTNEVRLLRVAVEKSTQTQTQLQGLSVFLSAQQSRVLQASARVDALRKDLTNAARDSRALADRIIGLQNALTTEQSPEVRQQFQEMLAASKREAAQATESENQIRVSEAEASAELQAELNRWSELTSRLEQVIKQ
jgi:hypothetical protein